MARLASGQTLAKDRPGIVADVKLADQFETQAPVIVGHPVIPGAGTAPGPVDPANLVVAQPDTAHAQLVGQQEGIREAPQQRPADRQGDLGATGLAPVAGHHLDAFGSKRRALVGRAIEIRVGARTGDARVVFLGGRFERHGKIVEQALVAGHQALNGIEALTTTATKTVPPLLALGDALKRLVAQALDGVLPAPGGEIDRPLGYPVSQVLRQQRPLEKVLPVRGFAAALEEPIEVPIEIVRALPARQLGLALQKGHRKRPGAITDQFLTTEVVGHVRDEPLQANLE